MSNKKGEIGFTEAQRALIRQGQEKARAQKKADEDWVKDKAGEDRWLAQQKAAEAFYAFSKSLNREKELFNEAFKGLSQLAVGSDEMALIKEGNAVLIDICPVISGDDAKHAPSMATIAADIAKLLASGAKVPVEKIKVLKTKLKQVENRLTQIEGKFHFEGKGGLENEVKEGSSQKLNVLWYNIVAGLRDVLNIFTRFITFDTSNNKNLFFEGSKHGPLLVKTPQSEGEKRFVEDTLESLKSYATSLKNTREQLTELVEKIKEEGPGDGPVENRR
jgi:hypothetical protein